MAKKGKRRKTVRRRRHVRAKSAPPRNSQEYFAMPARLQSIWDRAVQVPSEMRSKNITLRQASRKLGVSPIVVRRLAVSAFRKRRNGRYIAKPTDRLLRVLLIPSDKGLREIAVRDSREASLIGKYWDAVEKFLGRGDSSALNRLRRKSVRDENGKRIRLLVDLDELKRQASAGVLHFESLYGRSA